MNDMQNSFFGIIDVALIVAVILFNFSFGSMWKILYGKWYRWTPTWQWGKDIKELKRLSKNGETTEIRNKSSFALKGIYGSIGLLFLAILIDVFVI